MTVGEKENKGRQKRQSLSTDILIGGDRQREENRDEKEKKGRRERKRGNSEEIQRYGGDRGNRTAEALKRVRVHSQGLS